MGEIMIPPSLCSYEEDKVLYFSDVKEVSNTLHFADQVLVMYNHGKLAGGGGEAWEAMIQGKCLSWEQSEGELLAVSWQASSRKFASGMKERR